MKYSSRENKTETPQETTRHFFCVGMSSSVFTCEWIFFNVMWWGSERKAGCDAVCPYITSCDVGDPHCCLSPIHHLKTPQCFLRWCYCVRKFIIWGWEESSELYVDVQRLLFWGAHEQDAEPHFTCTRAAVVELILPAQGEAKRQNKTMNFTRNHLSFPLYLWPTNDVWFGVSVSSCLDVLIRPQGSFSFFATLVTHYLSLVSDMTWVDGWGCDICTRCFTGSARRTFPGRVTK